MNPLDIGFALKMWFRFRSYRPHRVYPWSVINWLYQYPENEHALIKKAASHLQYVPQDQFVSGLVDRNRALLAKLTKAGIKYSNIIYVSIGDAGSSSHAVLNLLRDKSRLENLGCKMIDAGSIDKLHSATSSLESGAIIYADDFAGTGRQFCEQRALIGSYIVGNFSQYFLLHTVCEEALVEVEKTGVNLWHSAIHEKIKRPLHESSTLLASTERDVLTTRTNSISKKGGLGFGGIAAMVVFYTNTPNSVPLLFRGDKGQKKYFGLVPRTTDLPAIPIS